MSERIQRLTDAEIVRLEHEIEVYGAYYISSLAKKALRELQERRAAETVDFVREAPTAKGEEDETDQGVSDPSS